MLAQLQDEVRRRVRLVGHLVDRVHPLPAFDEQDGLLARIATAGKLERKQLGGDVVHVGDAHAVQLLPQGAHLCGQVGRRIALFDHCRGRDDGYSRRSLPLLVFDSA